MAEIPEEEKKALEKEWKARQERWAKMTPEEKAAFYKRQAEIKAFLYPETRQKEDRQAK